MTQPYEPRRIDESVFRPASPTHSDIAAPAEDAPTRRKPRLWLRIVALLGAVLLALGAFYIVRAVVGASQVRRDDTLVIGYDGRPQAGLGQNYLVVSDSTTNRTDVVMLVHLNQARDQVYLVSLPRNLYVSVDGRSTRLQDIPTGTGALLRTVETVVGARIDHVARVDINGFVGLTEALGGVVVNNPYASQTSSGIRFDKGDITIKGETALAFVGDDSPIRNRDAVLAERQRSVLRAVVLKVLRPETLANPATFNSVVGDLTKFVTVDSGVTNAVMWDLASSIRLAGSEDVLAAQPPVKGVSSTASGDPITLLDSAKAAELGAALRGDTMQDYRSRFPA